MSDSYKELSRLISDDAGVCLTVNAVVPPFSLTKKYQSLRLILPPRVANDESSEFLTEPLLTELSFANCGPFLLLIIMFFYVLITEMNRESFNHGGQHLSPPQEEDFVLLKSVIDDPRWSESERRRFQLLIDEFGPDVKIRESLPSSLEEAPKTEILITELED